MDIVNVRVFDIFKFSVHPKTRTSVQLGLLLGQSGDSSDGGGGGGSGNFLEIFHKLTEIPTWSVTPNIQHMLLKKYEAPERGFPTVLYK